MLSEIFASQGIELLRLTHGVVALSHVQGATTTTITEAVQLAQQRDGFQGELDQETTTFLVAVADMAGVEPMGESVVIQGLKKWDVNTVDHIAQSAIYAFRCSRRVRSGA